MDDDEPACQLSNAAAQSRRLVRRYIFPISIRHDPEVEKYLIQNSIWWVEHAGYDAIRMDTLPHVPRTFWSHWASAIHREYSKVNILGELFDGDPALLSYFQYGRRGYDGIDTEIDTLFDFATFYGVRNAFAMGKLYEQSRRFRPTTGCIQSRRYLQLFSASTTCSVS